MRARLAWPQNLPWFTSTIWMPSLPSTLIVDAPDDMAVMQEEILGPILPALIYRDMAEVIAYINARPRRV